MFLDYSVTPFDTLFIQQITLQRRKFASVNFYGNVILDNVHSINKELTKNELDAISNDERQFWIDNATNFLSNFEDKLSSGNIINENIPITQWRLKRKRQDESKFTTLKTFEKGIDKFIDWTAGNNREYEYAVHAISSNIEGIATFGSAKLDFFGWVLTNGIDNYLFDIELKSGSITNNTDMKIYDNYTEYPTVNFGKRDYQQGNIETLPLSFKENEYVAELDVLEDLKNFINDKKIKLLKNTKGESWWVCTHSFSHTYMDTISEQPYTISFSWLQVDDGKSPFGGGNL